MRRLNVRSTQLDECIASSMFAISERPKNPPLAPGELLLLQLVKTEAEKSGKLHSRIEFALVFDRFEEDIDGSISRQHWPAANKTWQWIIYGSATEPTIPFSLEDLKLETDYAGENNARTISIRDEETIMPYIQGTTAVSSDYRERSSTIATAVKKFGRTRMLRAIQNHDRINARRTSTRKTVTTEQYIRNAALSECLKALYDYRCQLCGTTLESKYGNVVDQHYSYVDTHHIQYLSRGGLDISSNMIVVCPNHHRVIHATEAFFNRDTLTYEYPNGIAEKIILTDHFKNTLLD